MKDDNGEYESVVNLYQIFILNFYDKKLCSFLLVF